MPVSAEYKEFLQELFEPLGRIKTKSMFGVDGVFMKLPDGDLMFGLIADETLYLKVDDTTRADFEAEDKRPFVYESKNGKQDVASYYELPEALYDEPDVFSDWARKAFDVALRAKKPKKKRKNKS
ncbi:DNA transformation protein [Parasphingorhabdus marina DSM 22363]|uniref:DNA transformation protein n=1 Tax=Parasphingorhabdus marina DSM 22363 TaxID=1123272 RepID=A0A1N6FT45_9SPHN|nr:TfoX/Sxy family protein [Parasphingorhabdus marina]SIN98496.1 DNA transformation protein [Parasphingorhabdus marina DSM 22363]